MTSGFDNIAANYRVNDPFDGSNYKSLGTFLDEGYQLQWLVDYSFNGTLACRERTTKPQDQFSYGFQLTNPLDGLLAQSGTILSFTPEGTNPAIPKVYFVPKATTDDATVGKVASINGKEMLNGEVFSDEAFYKLVFEGDNGTGRNRTTIHFVVDKSPPLLVQDGAATTLDQPDKDGFQAAIKAPVLIGAKATDSLSGVATIQYRVAPATRSTAGTVRGLSTTNQVQATDWLLYNNDASTRPLAFEKAGDYEVYFRAIDGAGNISPDDSPLYKFTISQAIADAAKTSRANATPTPSASVSGATPTPEGPTVLVGSLKLTPETINFNSSQDSFNLVMNNSSGTPLSWNFEQPLPPQAQQYLDLGKLPQAGTIPSNGSLSVPLNLSNFNTTDKQISFPVNLLYNNGTASVTLTIVIEPQPALNVTFLSPATGVSLSGKQLSVALNVVATGKAKPTQAKLKATFATVIGAQPQTQIIGIANPSNNWRISWDISTIPPQQNISLGGDICWTNDDSQCQAIQGGVFGLSIARPRVRVELVPNSPILSAFTGIQATINSGVINHITYTYFYIDTFGNPKSETTSQPAQDGGTVNYTWDTRSIPPQEGTITLSARVCPGVKDDISCFEPSDNMIPGQLTIERSQITVNPLSSNEIPLTLNLSGQVSKLKKIGGAGVTIYFISVKTSPSAQPKTLPVKATLDPQSGFWTLSNFDTKQWPPQAITIVPKYCWDENGPDISANCTQVQTPINGVISSPLATMPPPTDFSQPVSLGITTTPPERVLTVTLQLVYQKFGSTSSFTSTLGNGQPLPVENNKASYNFNSVDLGIKPGIKVNFTLLACGPSGCGGITTVSPTASIPQTKIEPASLTPSLTILQGRPLKDNESISFRISGQNASSIVLTATNALNNQFEPKQPMVIQNPTTDNQVNLSWGTANIQPQSDIKLRYSFCYTGPLDSGCSDPADLYSGLSITTPIANCKKVELEVN